jgi:tetratricopeptide (TPR) repeat protein
VNFISPLRRDTLAFLVFPVLLLTACNSAKRNQLSDQERAKETMRQTLGKMVAGSKSLFLPPSCLGLLPKETPVRHPSPSQSAEALSNPSSFHSLNREYRFDRVYLPPGQLCAPLRDHLLESSVWVLSEVSPEGYLFSPAGARVWHPPDSTAITLAIPDPGKRSLWLIGAAENLIAIGHHDEAASLLNLASCSKQHESERLATLASLEASYGHWNKVLNLAGQSLRMNGRNRTATIIMIRALIETEHPGEAFSKARDFAESSPDPESIFLLARAANASGDHAEEINALRRLVLTAKEKHQPAGASLLYLGQALARDGQRGEALRVLEEGEKAPELSDDQKKLIKELHDHLAPSS